MRAIYISVDSSDESPIGGWGRQMVLVYIRTYYLGRAEDDSSIVEPDRYHRTTHHARLSAQLSVSSKQCVSASSEGNLSYVSLEGVDFRQAVPAVVVASRNRVDGGIMKRVGYGWLSARDEWRDEWRGFTNNQIWWPVPRPAT